MVTVVEYDSKRTLSSYFVRNITEEQLVYLFTEQPSKLTVCLANEGSQKKFELQYDMLHTAGTISHNSKP